MLFLGGDKKNFWGEEHAIHVGALWCHRVISFVVYSIRTLYLVRLNLHDHLICPGIFSQRSFKSQLLSFNVSPKHTEQAVVCLPKCVFYNFIVQSGEFGE